MSNKNEGRRVYVEGNDLAGYDVYTIEPDGTIEPLDCRSVTVTVQRNADGSTSALAVVYFTSPELNILAPRHADGVRAG